MLLAIELLKECRVIFEKKLDQMVREAQSNGKNVTTEDLRKHYPLLSAVAVDKNGDIVKTAFKGERGCMDDHCEYTLFEEILSNTDKERIKGGTLYVTLEPCNKRGAKKIPCAVRCVEAGISKIYIGTHDPDESVKWKGITTLKTGTYSFKVDNNDYIMKKYDADKKADIMLMKHFNSKKYSSIYENGLKIYKIGNSVEVRFFHPDLSIEIMQLNKEFIEGKGGSVFAIV